ncbi:unnamed protein product [Meloidogyne enterolobii]|uniref:Uncharacterized protein n=1 Tax=Meloidogyne enterolobii TaxID=390850 RepID=A0ACB0Y3S6_MELEN
MKKEDTDNALKSEKILYKLYLPALEERGFDATGTFREWRKKSGMIPEKGETLEDFNGRVEKAIAKRDDKSKVSGGKKKKGGKVKRI